MKIWIFTAQFFVILIAIIVINFRLNKEFRIDMSWIALALAPLVIWLITTNQLAEFSGFGLAFKLNEVAAKSVSIENDGALIDPEPISSDTKQGLGKIDSFIRRRVSAITLQTNRPNYYNNRAIGEYLERLTQYPFFRFVLFTNPAGEFWGIIDARKLLYEIRDNRLNIVALLEAKTIDRIPGLTRFSIQENSSKRRTLELMDKEGLSEIPVVDRHQRFIGIVTREKITSSIVVQLVSSSSK